MPDDSNGNFTLTNGYLAVTGQKVLASQHNPPLEDIASSMTARFPRDGRAPMLGDVNMNSFGIKGLKAGVASTDAATVAQTQTATLASTPIGSILDYAGSSAPSGWLLCYGQTVSRTTYSALFTAIGTAFGVGDGASTFGLPDLRGRVIAGKDNMGGTSADRLTAQTGGLDGDVLGAAGGAETHTLTSDQMPQHSHTATVTDPTHAHKIYRGGGTLGDFQNVQGVSGAYPGALSSLSEAVATGITVANSNAGGSGAHNNVQPTLILNKIIRYA